MPLHFDHLEFFNKDWQCSEYFSDYPGQEAAKPWQTSNGISQSLVCEDCLYLEFDKALQYDGCFPARFRGAELDPRHFKTFLSPNYINQYVGRYAGISAQRASTQAHFPELLKWGVDYQICPGCKSAACLDDEEGCRQVVCVCCLTSFVFRCGEAAEDVDELDREGHWSDRNQAWAQSNGNLVGVQSFDYLINQISTSLLSIKCK